MNASFDRRAFLGRCAAGGLAPGSAGMTGPARGGETSRGRPTAQEPIYIGDRLGPLIDGYLVDTCQGAALRMQTPATSPDFLHWSEPRPLKRPWGELM